MLGPGSPRSRKAIALLAMLALAGAPARSPAQGDRPGEVGRRLGQIDAYLRASKPYTVDGKPRDVVGYEWFAHLPPGSTGVESIPTVLYRLLPDLAKRLDDRDPLAPDQFAFGEPADNLAKFGFLADDPPRPLPLGFSWTAPSPAMPLSIAVRTCAACHVGRVRLDDATGATRPIVGGPNTEILLHQYDTALAGFFKRWLDPPAGRVRLKRELLALLDEKQKESPTWFFRGAAGFDAAAERTQVATFRAVLLRPEDRIDVLTPIQVINALRSASRDRLRAVAYAKANSPPIDAGPPGFFDSSGLGLAAFVTAPADIFPGATKNDIPAVWDQKTRTHWQWDGNVRDTLSRNMVASLGLVGLPQDLDVAANYFISDFIDGLPPAPYPFAVDLAAAARGERTFRRNCVGCHVPDQHRLRKDHLPVYRLGTDLNRARVVTPGGFLAIQQVLVDGHQPESLTIARDGQTATPARVDPDALLVDRTAPDKQGYVAGPLDGIWARAPYLHNGSVPTLRHLLGPKLRAGSTRFVRGIISYDPKNVGWIWSIDDLPRYQGKDRSARVYDTTLDGQSNRGHDRLYFREGDKTYRLSWDDPADPELNDLLEYLKTL